MDTKMEIEKQKIYIENVKKINENRKLKYSILTMGCQLNENDSEKLCGMIEKMGYERTENQAEADLSLFNTCCVRENAEDKLFGKLGELKKVKEQRGTIIAIRWMYDARKTYYRKNKGELSIYRYNLWNAYIT